MGWGEAYGTSWCGVTVGLDMVALQRNEARQAVGGPEREAPFQGMS